MRLTEGVKQTLFLLFQCCIYKLKSHGRIIKGPKVLILSIAEGWLLDLGRHCTDYTWFEPQNWIWESGFSFTRIDHLDNEVVPRACFSKCYKYRTCWMHRTVHHRRCTHTCRELHIWVSVCVFDKTRWLQSIILLHHYVSVMTQYFCMRNDKQM